MKNYDSFPRPQVNGDNLKILSPLTSSMAAFGEMKTLERTLF